MSLKKFKNLGISCFVAGAMILGGLSFFQPAKVYADNTLPQTFEYNVGDMGLTVGDQGGTQLCWAYTSSKVLETLIYNATTPNTAVNISEDWISLAYMYYVNDENQSLISEGKSTDDKTTYLYGQTGIPHFFQRVVNAYGLMFEEDFTLTETVTPQNYKEIFETSKANASKNIISNIAPFWVGGIAPYATQNDIVNTIKDYLYNNGAVYTAVNSITSGNEYNYVYHATTADLGHALTIIGYDDTMQIDVGGEVKTGAFKLLNSYGNYRQIVYMPYDMMSPNIVEIGENKTETNAVLSNTYVFNVEFNTGDNPGGNDTPTNPNPNQPTNPDEPENPTDPNEPTDPNTPVDPNPDAPTDPDDPNEPVDPNPNDPTEPEDPDEPNEPADPSAPVVPDDPNDGPNDPNEDISGGSGTTNNIDQLLENLMGRYDQKSGGEKAVVVFAVLAMLGLAGVGIGFGVATFINRSRTAAINQSAFGDSVQQYRQHQLLLAQQKTDLEKQIADMRAEAKKRKQRRLKREFKKKLEENQ